jgi:CheY-like chemotaxis protein
MQKILIVDDVKLLRDILKRYLDTAQVEVLTAECGAEALEIIHQELPDLIIMDRYMPGMDGLACCVAIKSNPAIAYIPVIMATTAAEEEDAKEYLRVGAADVLAKPIASSTFLEMLKKHLPEFDMRSPRVAETLDMTITADGRQYDAATKDISSKGAFAVSDLHVAVNDELQFTFLLPDKEVPIEVLGRVVWLKKGEGVAGFGVEFNKFTGQGVPMLRLGELENFVNSKRKS